MWVGEFNRLPRRGRIRDAGQKASWVPRLASSLPPGPVSSLPPGPVSSLPPTTARDAVAVDTPLRSATS
jgi:hypothetical protein